MSTATIGLLNSLLREELAAVATYHVTLQERSELSYETELWRCQRSHERRVAFLRQKILALGGQPASTSGLTSRWTKLAENAATIPEDMALRALEQEEVQVRHDYWQGLASVGPEVREFLEELVLPEEEYTHRTLSDLAHRLAPATATP